MQHQQQTQAAQVAQVQQSQQCTDNSTNNVSNIHPPYINAQFLQFITQLQQYPPLFQHLQNHPDLLASLLKQFIEAQDKLLINNGNYNITNNNT